MKTEYSGRFHDVASTLDFWLTEGRKLEKTSDLLNDVLLLFFAK